MATKAEKKQRVRELADFVAGAPLWMVSDYRGLSVPAFAELRGKLREHEAGITVAKNTLFRRVLEAPGLESSRRTVLGTQRGDRLPWGRGRGREGAVGSL